MKHCRSWETNKMILKGLRWQLYPTRDACRCFMLRDFSSAGSPNEYANGCSSVGSVSYANKNTSFSYSSDALVVYVTDCLANVPATFHSKHRADLTPLRCKLVTYEQHMRAAQISLHRTAHYCSRDQTLDEIPRGCLNHKVHAQILY